MSVLGGVVIEFAAQMRPHLRGWTIAPRIVRFEWGVTGVNKHTKHTEWGWIPASPPYLVNQTIAPQRVPNHVSPWTLFLENPPENNALIFCKAPKSIWRVIQLQLDERAAEAQISLFWAGGYKAGIYYHHTSYKQTNPQELPENCDGFRLGCIEPRIGKQRFPLQLDLHTLSPLTAECVAYTLQRSLRVERGSPYYRKHTEEMWNPNPQRWKVDVSEIVLRDRTGR